ncbi:MAG: hypothetical protein K0B09_14875 [Bacteroidales bacterium]|nr:hypothetical protein [Bacteroidales bacterium]
MRRSLAFFVAISFLAGCASIGPQAEKLSLAETSNFYKEPSQGRAALYFRCGSWKTESWLAKSENTLPFCALQVNGNSLKRVVKDSVGRVEVAVGVLTLQPVPEESLATYVPLQLEVREGDVVLVTQNLVHKMGPLGGAMSGGFTYSLEWTKDEVMTRVRKSQPVRMSD